ncbi:MAG: hypothetical protein R6V19_01775 [Armatimonadota bacterium]
MRRGATLISTIVAVGLLAATMAAMVHIYQISHLAVETSDYRLEALMAAESSIERMTTRGYTALPEPGSYPLEDALENLPHSEGQVEVAEGPADGTKTVTVTVRWQTRDERPVSQVQLTRIFAERGMDG